MGGPAPEDAAAVLQHKAILAEILGSQCMAFYFLLCVVGYLVTVGRGNKKTTWQFKSVVKLLIFLEALSLSNCQHSFF